MICLQGAEKEKIICLQGAEEEKIICLQGAEEENIICFAGSGRWGCAMDIEKKYTLRLYDKPVADFIVHYNGYECSIDEDEIRHHEWKLMPEKSDPLFEWVEKRAAAKYREYGKELFECAGISPEDITAVLDVSMGLSATDAYWITPEGFDGRFADYNLYEHDFPEELAVAAFCGKVSDCSPLTRPSPEFSVCSAAPKCWRRIDGKLWLYKTASEKDKPYRSKETAQIELMNEYYAAQVAELIGVEHVSYEPEMYLGRLAMKCVNYTDIDHSSVSIYKVLEKNNIFSVCDFLEKHGLMAQYADMVLLDAILRVDSRDYGDIEVLKNNHTQEYERLAPAFHNGCCLYSSVPEHKLEDPHIWIKHDDSYIGQRGHDQMVAVFCSRRHLEKLRKLYYFRFRRHPLCSLSEKRLHCMEQLVQKRARELTEIIMKYLSYRDMFPEDRGTLKETFSGDYRGYTYYYDGDSLRGGTAMITGRRETTHIKVPEAHSRGWTPLEHIRKHIDEMTDKR